jgi:hypothetical protein
MQMSGYAKSAWQHCTQRGAHRLSTEAPTVRAGRFWSRLRLSVPPLGLPPEWGSKHRIMAEPARMAGAVFAQGGSFNITDAQSEFVQLIAVQAVETRSALARSEIGKKNATMPVGSFHRHASPLPPGSRLQTTPALGDRSGRSWHPPLSQAALLCRENGPSCLFRKTN